MTTCVNSFVILPSLCFLRKSYKEEIEAWILADESFCKWVDEKPKNCDGINKPSDRVNSLLQSAHRMSYKARGRQLVLDNLDGTGDKYSPSMQKALTHLENAPCTT